MKLGLVFLGMLSVFAKNPPAKKAMAGSEAYRQFPLAGMTYCDDPRLTRWNCRSCKKTKGVKVVKIITDPILQTKAIIFRNSLTRELVLAFRGAFHKKNWDLLYNLSPTRYPLAPENATVHTGILTMANSLNPKFVPLITKLLKSQNFKGYRLVVVGHSLGGALATLAVPILKRKTKLPWSRIKVYTYGSPRVGNANFATWFNNQNIPMTRVVTHGDDTPSKPAICLGYSHVKTEMYIKNNKARICNSKLLEDPKCSVSSTEVLQNAHYFAWDQDVRNIC